MNNFDDDSESELTEDEEFDTSLATSVHEFAVDCTKKLSQLVKTFPHIPHDQEKAWLRLVAPIIKSTVPSFKFALIGKTGSGKSTLINGLLGHSVVPTSAAGACTSAITEISYKDMSLIEGTVFFLSKEEGQEKTKILLDAVHHQEDNSSDSFSNRSRDTLYTVYPGLRNKNLATITATQLVKMEPAKSRLGTSHVITPSDADTFRTQLEQFLSSSNSDNAVLWPLVRRVEVRGKFSCLSSGVVLVDLPGDGDDDDTRNSFVADYMKVANGYILVADAKRAQDDRNTHDYLRKILNGLLLDRRSVEDSIVLAATGTDTVIGDNEIPVPQDQQLKVKTLNEELHSLRQSLRPPKKSKSAKHKQKDLYSQLAVEHQIREREREKGLLFANIRRANVRKSLQDFSQGITASFAHTRNENDEVHRLPVFCLGSQDFHALSSGLRSPLVFYREEETEVPALATHIRNVGERRRIKWASTILAHADSYAENIHSYFSEGRHPGRLPAENKKRAIGLIAELEERNLQEANDAFEGIEDELGNIAKELKKAVTKATASAPKIVTDFGRIHWSSYKACMASDGIHHPYDLNRDLTKSILPAISSSWNAGINHRIPLVLKDSTAAMEEDILGVVDEVVQVLNGSSSETAIGGARRRLPIESILGDLLQENIKSILVAQRDGTRSFKNTVQEQWLEQYRSTAKESGSGSFARMKASNQAFIEQNTDNIFGLITTSIQNLLHTAFGKIKKDTRGEISTISLLLRVSLVDDINLAGDHKEIKDAIINMTLENRPGFTSRRQDLDGRRRALGMSGQGTGVAG
ncbi:hypothetical protein C8R46DRAFT_503011 [Mycena filopes]|nr:hypothetical protein C8R46DRAFT_503011 [Mycena filopes]